MSKSNTDALPRSLSKAVSITLNQQLEESYGVRLMALDIPTLLDDLESAVNGCKAAGMSDPDVLTAVLKVLNA